MINLLVTENPGDNVYRVITYLFNDEFQFEWIESDFARQVIADIDKSTVINGRLIDSPFLGKISPVDLAGGTKRILLARFYDFPEDTYLSVTNCGDNCDKWLQVAGAARDINLQVEVAIKFEDSAPWPIRIENTGVLVYNYDEYIEEYAKSKCKGFIR